VVHRMKVVVGSDLPLLLRKLGNSQWDGFISSGTVYIFDTLPSGPSLL